MRFGILSHALTRDSSRGEVLRLLNNISEQSDLVNISYKLTPIGFEKAHQVIYSDELLIFLIPNYPQLQLQSIIWVTIIRISASVLRTDLLSISILVLLSILSSVIGQDPLLTAVASTVFDGFSAFVQKLQSSYPPLFVIDTLIAMVTRGTANGFSLNIIVAFPQNFSFRRCCPVDVGIAGGDADRLTDCIQIAEFYCVFLIGISHRTEAGCPSNWIPVNILILLEDQSSLFIIGVHQRGGFFIVHRDGLAEQQLLNVEVPEIPFFSGGLHHGEIVDLDLVARLGVGGVQLPALGV